MYRKVVSLLKVTLNEEKTGDVKMTAADVTAINADAAELTEMD